MPRETIGDHDERRDYRRRAECPRRLMTRLLAVENGLGVADLADDRMSFEAAQRILKRFVVKGFVRHDDDRWLATPLLIRGAHIVLAEGSA